MDGERGELAECLGEPDVGRRVLAYAQMVEDEGAEDLIPDGEGDEIFGRFIELGVPNGRGDMAGD